MRRALRPHPPFHSNSTALRGQVQLSRRHLFLVRRTERIVTERAGHRRVRNSLDGRDA